MVVVVVGGQCEHSQQRECPARFRRELLVGDDVGERYLVYRCRHDFRCGGLGDRVSGMIGGMVLAGFTGRRFRVDWPDLAARYSASEWPWRYAASSLASNASLRFINEPIVLEDVAESVVFFASNRFSLDGRGAAVLRKFGFECSGGWEEAKRWFLSCAVTALIPLERERVARLNGSRHLAMPSIVRLLGSRHTVAFHVRVQDKEASAQAARKDAARTPTAPTFRGYPLSYPARPGSPLRDEAFLSVARRIISEKTKVVCVLATNSAYERDAFLGLATDVLGCDDALVQDFHHEAHIARLERKIVLDAALLDFHLMRLSDVLFMPIDLRVSALSAMAASAADPCQIYFDVDSGIQHNYTHLTCKDRTRWGGGWDQPSTAAWAAVAACQRR